MIMVNLHNDHGEASIKSSRYNGGDNARVLGLHNMTSIQHLSRSGFMRSIFFLRAKTV